MGFQTKQDLNLKKSKIFLPAIMPKIFSYKEKYFAAVTAIEKTNADLSFKELLEDEDDSLEIPDDLKEFLRDEFPYQILHFLLVAKANWAKTVTEFVDFNKILIKKESEEYVVQIDHPHLTDPDKKENAGKSYKKQLEEIFDSLERKLDQKLNLHRFILEDISFNSQKEDRFTPEDLVGLFQEDKYIKVEYSKQNNPWGKYHSGKIYLNRSSDSKKNEVGEFEPSLRRKEKKRDLEEPERFPMYTDMKKDDDDEFTCKKWTKDNNDQPYEIYKFRHPEKLQSILRELFEGQYIYGVEICPEYKSKKNESDKEKKNSRKSDASKLYYTVAAVILVSYLLF